MKKSMFVCPSVPGAVAMGMNVMAFSSAHMSVRAFGAMLLAVSLGGAALAQGAGTRGGAEREGDFTRAVRTEHSADHDGGTDRAAASGPPGCGCAAKPSADGWTHDHVRRGQRHLPISANGSASGRRPA